MHLQNLIKMSKRFALNALPRTFESTTKAVDVDLVKELFKFTPGPSPKIKDLLFKIGKKRLGNEDPYEALCNEVASPQFREAWYQLAAEESKSQKRRQGRIVGSKKKYPSSLFSLVDEVLRDKEGALQEEMPSIAKFYKKSKEGRAIAQVEHIETLGNYLIALARHSLRDASLFTWSVLERHEWYVLHSYAEEASKTLREALFEELEKRKAVELLELLQDGEYPISDPKPISQSVTEISGKQSSLKALEPKKEVVAEIYFESESIQEFNLFCSSKFLELDEELRTFKDLQAAIFEKVTALADFDSLNKKVEDAVDSIEHLRNVIENLNSCADEIEGRISSDVEVKLGSLLANYGHVPLLRYSAKNHAIWKEEAVKRQKSSVEVMKLLDTLNQLDSELVKSISIEGQYHPTSLEDAKLCIQTIEKKAKARARGLAARQKLFDKLISREGDFSWNPILDPNISDESWVHLGEFLSNYSLMPEVFGICVRKHYEALKGTVAKFLDDCAILDEIPLEHAFRILSCMSEGQIDGIRCESEGGRIIIASYALESFFHRVDVSNTDAFAFLAVDPLRTYLNEQNPEVVGQFFEATYHVATSESKLPFRLSELIRLVTTTRGTNFSSSDESKEKLRPRLLSFLEMHRGGGPTHAQLRELAYLEICQPLRDPAERGDLPEVAERYRKIRKQFDFDERMRDWRTVIPENRSKESDYKHQLRLWVKNKLQELDNWVYEFESTRQYELSKMENQSIVNLKGVISSVLASRDVGCLVLQRWFESVSASNRDGATVLVGRSNSLGPNLDLKVKISCANPQHPRTFIAGLKGQTVSTAELFCDYLFLNFGLYQPIDLAKYYVDQKWFEAFRELRVATQVEVPLDLVREVEDAEEVLANQQTSRIEAIEVNLGDLGKDDAELIASLLIDIKELVGNQRWTLLETELQGLERIHAEMRLKLSNASIIRNLVEEIRALGGIVPADHSLATVQAEHSRIVAESAVRRRHLGCIAKLAGELDLDKSVLHAANECLNCLQRPEMLPDAERSGIVEMIFADTLLVLIEQLKNSYFFLPEIKNTLNNLAISVFNSLQHQGVLEESRAIDLLLDNVDSWSAIRGREGESAAKKLLSMYPQREFTGSDTSVVRSIEPSKTTPSERPSVSIKQNEAVPDHSVLYAAYVGRLEVSLAKIITTDEVESHSNADSTKSRMIEKTNWETAKEAYRKFKSATPSKSGAALNQLVECALMVLRAKEQEISLEDYATVLHLINENPNLESVRSILQVKGVKVKGPPPLSEIVNRFLVRIAMESGISQSENPVDLIQNLSSEISKVAIHKDIVQIAFSPVGSQEPITLKTIWESYSGDPKQAEARADLMNVLWQCAATSSLAYCFQYTPIDIAARTASALADNASRALSNGKAEHLQSFMDLRNGSARPFQLFVNHLLTKMPSNDDLPAEICIARPLERTGEKNILAGVISIKPRRRESPNSITLLLPKISPIEFYPGVLRHELIGPFIQGEELLSVKFILKEHAASNFTTVAECEAISITGDSSKYSTRLNFEILGENSFYKLTPEKINDAFNGFQSGQMRGNDYIPRPAAEKKILDSLILSNTIRSIWITSPRRSGKTTILYWILDQYSQKKDRDNLVVYISLVEKFQNAKAFNSKIWDGIMHHPDNKKLKELLPDFGLTKRTLPFDVEPGVFIEIMSKSILQITNGNRIIFLFDEVDKLATMHFAGEPYRSAAEEIVWSLRDLTQRVGNIGFVFAGSSAAKKIFITNPEAPFFGSGIHYELPPFSSDTKINEEASRSLVEPAKIRGVFSLPKDSLDYLLWICSGIPYYMKLLAGSTYAVSRQSYILKSDINEGLYALLGNTTGIPTLGGGDGTRGADELRTIALEKGLNRTLMLAVLYATAEMESPVSGKPIRRANLYSNSSPLVSRYKISRKNIEDGLDMAIELGLFKVSSDNPPQITFAMPILGESIRFSIGSYWAGITHQLEELSSEI